MSDTRSVATDALSTLGTVIDATAKRDAIHLAVVPAVAGQRLEAGWHVTVVDGIATTADQDDEDAPLGIVDPFLKRPVKKGERFWLVIYPRTIQSLRHVWTHPAFPEEPGIAAVSDKTESERWLREFCSSHNVPCYETVLGLVASNDDDDYLTVRDADASGEIPCEFWDHAEVVLGRKLTHRPAFFSCSC
jgi:hypothetical protein